MSMTGTELPAVEDCCDVWVVAMMRPAEVAEVFGYGRTGWRQPNAMAFGGCGCASTSACTDRVPAATTAVSRYRQVAPWRDSWSPRPDCRRANARSPDTRRALLTVE